MLKVFGSAGTLDDIIPSGMTDTQIMFEALKSEGFKSEQIFERKDEFLKVLKSRNVESSCGSGEPYEMFSGAKEILWETDKNPNFINALLTGNLSVAAEIKLRSVGLGIFLKMRRMLLAKSRTNGKIWQSKPEIFLNKNTISIFRPNNLSLSATRRTMFYVRKHFGAKSVAVLTGRNQTRENLQKENPDVIIDDLTDTKKLIEIFGNL